MKKRTCLTPILAVVALTGVAVTYGIAVAATAGKDGAFVAAERNPTGLASNLPVDADLFRWRGVLAVRPHVERCPTPGCPPLLDATGDHCRDCLDDVSHFLPCDALQGMCPDPEGSIHWTNRGQGASAGAGVAAPSADASASGDRIETCSGPDADDDPFCSPDQDLFGRVGLGVACGPEDLVADGSEGTLSDSCVEERNRADGSDRRPESSHRRAEGAN